MKAPNYRRHANPQLKVSCPSLVAAAYPPVPVYHQCIQCFLYPRIQSCIHSLPHLGTHVVLCVHPLLVPCPWMHPLTPCPSLISGILAAIQGAGRRVGTGSTGRPGLRGVRSGREESHRENSHHGRGKGLVPMRGPGVSGKRGGLLGAGSTWIEVSRIINSTRVEEEQEGSKGTGRRVRKPCASGKRGTKRWCCVRGLATPRADAS